MADDKLHLSLEPITDRNGNTYYIAKLKGPFTINCKDGVAFMVFVSEPGSEELQIANVLPPKNKGNWDNNNDK